MGLSSSSPEIVPLSYNRRAYSNLSPTSSSFTLLLSDLRQKLTIPECAYVLITLMSQYFLLFRNKIKFVVNDYLCRVTQEGQVLVFSWNGNNEQGNNTSNYIKIFSQILEIVKRLSQNKESFENSSILGHLKQIILSILYHNIESQQRTYSLLLTQIHHYLQSQLPEVNLKSALSRELKDSIVHHKQHKRYQSDTFHPSFGNIDLNSKTYIIRNRQNLSCFKKNNAVSHFHPFQQDQDKIHYQQPQINYSLSTISIQATRSSQSKLCQRSKKCTISALFSITILSSSPCHKQKKENSHKQQPSKRSCIRTNKRYATQNFSSKYPENKVKLTKNNTSINLHTNTQKDQERKPERSALWTMARVVEVREEPSSKAIIS